MMRIVTIHPVLNGWTVKVGCQTVVYTDKSKFLKDLGEYLTDADAKEKKFIAGAVNKKLMNGCPVPNIGPPAHPNGMLVTGEPGIAPSSR